MVDSFNRISTRVFNSDHIVVDMYHDTTTETDCSRLYMVLIASDYYTYIYFDNNKQWHPQTVGNGTYITIIIIPYIVHSATYSSFPTLNTICVQHSWTEHKSTSLHIRHNRGHVSLYSWRRCPKYLRADHFLWTLTHSFVSSGRGYHSPRGHQSPNPSVARQLQPSGDYSITRRW